MGYRCFSVHFFFKIIGWEKYKNEQGYVVSELKFKRAIHFDFIDTEEKFIEEANKLREKLAKSCNVPLANVVLLTRDEYEAITDEENCLAEIKF